jgi:hypothetical protein
VHATEKEVKDIINPVAGNPEVFLFQKDSVLGIPVERLYNDLRLMGWETTYTPTPDGQDITSQANLDNSILGTREDINEIRAIPNEMKVFSIKLDNRGKGIFVGEDAEKFQKELRGELYPYIIDLEAIKLEELEEYTRGRE